MHSDGVTLGARLVGVAKENIGAYAVFDFCSLVRAISTIVVLRTLVGIPIKSR